MTFLAPRQGLFAAIILVSLFLQTLFFVISQEQVVAKTHRAAAEQSIARLADELKVPLANADRVSMSVIADNRLKESQLAFIGIYDAKDELLVPVGSNDETGVQLKEPVVSGSQALGSVVVATKPISRAQIISHHWLFLLGVIGLHAMLWLIYGYLARPSNDVIQQLTQSVRQDLLEKGLLSEQSEPAKTQPTATPNTEPKPDVQADDPKKQSALGKVADDDMVVQILFEDPHSLLSTIGHDSKSAYFALCDQLIDKALAELLALPLLQGVRANVVKYHDEQGAKVALSGDASAKVGLAAVLLSKLTIMLNQVVYDKHRELKRFSLQVRTTVSRQYNSNSMKDLTKKRREAPLVLLGEKEQKELQLYIELARLENPVSVLERESRMIATVTKSTAERLTQVRNKVLLES